MKKRIELIILENKKIEELEEILDLNVGSIYVKVDLSTLSNSRSYLISKNYTTRLMVIKQLDSVLFYIYGKKKGGKGVFNEHCKNSVIKVDDYLGKLIEVSSNPEDTVKTDSKIVLNKLKEMGRIGELL